MSNDTVDNEPDDSHVPFISNRNEHADEGVQPDMSDTIPTPAEDAPTLSTTEAAPDSEPGPVTAMAGDDTGEMDATPPPGDEKPSVIQTATFDYDNYYGSEGFPAPPPDPWAEAATQPAAPTKRDGAMFFVGVLAAGVLGAALTVGVLAATGTFTPEAEPTTTPTTVALVTTPISTSDPAVTNQIINEIGSAVNPTAVAIKTIPSIVTVTTFSDDPADETENIVGLGSGSGVVISEDGFIATNEHVINGATEFRVTFEDGRIYTAELIGSDELTDLAVLQISAANLVPIDFGSADALALGDPAVAVGNPLGQDGGSSISVGIVSAFDRRVDFGDGSSLFGMIQTDAAINSGSSGGALVNASGELIGITAAIGVSNAGPEGIGYAIPVELVVRITDEIIETGDVMHPFLGVQITTFAEEQADGAVLPTGAEIQSIEGSDSAAGAAGLEAGDIIIGIGDKEISSQNDLILAVRLYRVGDEVLFTAERGEETLTFNVVMGERPAEFGG